MAGSYARQPDNFKTTLVTINRGKRHGKCKGFKISKQLLLLLIKVSVSKKRKAIFISKQLLLLLIGIENVTI